MRSRTNGSGTGAHGPEPFVTVFPNTSASRISAARPMSFAELEHVIRKVKAADTKEGLPLFKLAKFGSKRTKQDALRHNDNVEAVYGIEGDYDGEKVPMSWAAEALSSRGVAAVLYTSSSHTPETPRWRVMVALSYALEGSPEEIEKQRSHWCGVLNAVLGGILAAESFTLSQCYFFGPVKGAHQPEIIRLDGMCLDQMEEIPAPVYPAKKAPTGPRGGATYDETTDEELKELIRHPVEKGKRYPAMRSLIARWAVNGLSVDDIAQGMFGLLGDNPPPFSTGRDPRTVVRQMAESAVRKFADSRKKRHKAADVPEPPPMEDVPIEAYAGTPEAQGMQRVRGSAKPKLKEQGKEKEGPRKADGDPKPNGDASPQGASATDGYPDDYGSQMPPYAGQVEPQEDPWLEPTNLINDLEAQPFDGSEVPDVLSRYPLLYYKQTGIDLTVGLVAAVTVAAGALSDDIKVRGDSIGHRLERPCLWNLAIGGPGTRKTPAQKHFLEPLMKIDAEEDAKWRARVKNMSKEEIEKCGKPPRTDVVIESTTIEGLRDVLVNNERGMMLYTDEFEGWIGSMDAYRKGGSSQDRSHWRAAYDGGPRKIIRSTRDEPIRVGNWSCSFLSAVTPAELVKLAPQIGLVDGLMARFMTVLVRNRVQPRDEDMPDLAELTGECKAYEETIRRLYRVVPLLQSGNGIVRLSAAAMARFKAFELENQELREGMEGLDDALAAHVNKYDAMALRLALVFHAAQVVNRPEVQERDPAAYEISLETLECAIRFVKRLFWHALAIYGSRQGGSPAYQLAREIAKAILARGWTSISRRELTQSVRAFRCADEKLQREALQLLADCGWVRPAQGSYKKGSPTHYTVNPAVARMFAEIAEKEQKRRAIVRKHIREAVKSRRAEKAEAD